MQKRPDSSSMRSARTRAATMCCAGLTSSGSSTHRRRKQAGSSPARLVSRCHFFELPTFAMMSVQTSPAAGSPFVVWPAGASTHSRRCDWP